jgi:tetratricopeptide (TPR) repeat protein
LPSRPDPPTGDHWRCVERLFEEALTLPPGERTAFMDAQCGADAALRAELARLLYAHERLSREDNDASGFLSSLDAPCAAALLRDAHPDQALEEAPGDAAAAEQTATVGRYRIVRRLARGGMGVVYLAQDPSLERDVALKVISPHLSTDAAAKRRFVEEARAASALDHPHIATVFEIGETEDERLYIAMAYYDGDALRDRLGGGPLPVRAAAGIAAQVAGGLAAAHAGGIVHRDIKPENLVLTADDAVKIVDFGVAKVAESDLTRTGMRLGTAAYMSPEQTRGDPVDGRTDIWSLGVVLYEMLTGRRPFRGASDDAVLYGIRNDAPEPVRIVRPEVPPDLAALVERCLEKDPAQRPRSAAELAAALQAFAGEETSGPAPTGGGARPASPRRSRARRALVATAFVLAVAAGGSAAMHVLGIGPAGTLAARGLIEPRQPIILADFAAEAADPRIGRVVTEALRIDLLQSPALRLAEPADVFDGLRRMGRDPAGGVPEDAARELALREGLKAVIAGEVAALGGSYVLTARVVGATDGATLAAFRETARDSTGLIDAVDRLSKRMRERVGEPLRAVRASEPLPRVATASLTALRLYAEGAEISRSGGDDARIAALMEEAIALDSMFASAHRALSVAYWNMRANHARVTRATQRAYALRHRLPEREKLLAEANYYFNVLGDTRRSADVFRRVLALDPESDAALNNLGLSYLFEGRFEEAEAVLRPGLEPGRAAVIRLNVADALNFQGRPDAAIAVLDSGTISSGPSPVWEIGRIRILAANGHWDQSEAAATATLDAYVGAAAVRMAAVRSLWHLALVRGRLTEAERHYAELVSLAEDVGATEALARAMVQRAEAWQTLLGDSGRTRAAIDSLLARPSLDVMTAGATVGARVGAALAAAGDTARAARMLEAWDALPVEMRSDPSPYTSAVGWARIEMAAGRAAAAVERLTRPAADPVHAIYFLPDLGAAHERVGRPDLAIEAFERYVTFRHSRRLHRVPGHLGPVLLRLGALYEAAGDRARALERYGELVDLWRDADPELQPAVRHAESRIRALARSPADPGSSRRR